ncbi:SLAM family member 9-like [Perca fluviatilis]|uniref:SLAM family member 9-like n=1 Tax=Perca fluviatilis TaxID=8168 RepID=UPI0019653337|nr:SLAM family member 9-like [Perca fluviatilis]
MEKLTGCWLLLAALNFALAQDTSTYFRDGGELTMDLRPPSSEPLNNILWKINGDLVAEWIKDAVPLAYYRTFNDRTTLDLTTGRLEIKHMTKNDTGVYSVEVNNKVQNERYNALLIKEVPQPEVWIRPLTCSPASDNCTLVCDGNITEPAGPVTYSWKKDGAEWKESGKNLVITKSGTSDVKTFTCRIQNPVSVRDSKPRDNPLLDKKPGSSGAGALVACSIVTIAVVVGAAVAGL